MIEEALQDSTAVTVVCSVGDSSRIKNAVTLYTSTGLLSLLAVPIGRWAISSTATAIASFCIKPAGKVRQTFHLFVTRRKSAVATCARCRMLGVKVCICDAEEYGLPSKSVKSMPKFKNRIQLIFLQQYFPIPVLCNITRYCTGVIARAGLRSILATMMCFNQNRYIRTLSYLVLRMGREDAALVWIISILHSLACISRLFHSWAAFSLAYGS